MEIVESVIRKMRRKLLVYVTALSLGIVTFFVLKTGSVVVFVALIVLLFAFQQDKFSIKSGDIQREYFILLFLFMIGMVFSCIDEYIWLSSELPLDDLEHNFVGRVAQINKKDDGSFKILLRVMSTDQNRTKGRVMFSYYKDIADYYDLIGSVIKGRGTFTLPARAGNPKCFDYSQYLRAVDIRAVGKINFFDVQNENPAWYESLERYIVRLKDDFIHSFSQNAHVAGFLRGVLFGDTELINDDIYDDFRVNGTAHILAVSGLHVGILYKLYCFFKQKISTQLLTPLFLCLLFFYGTMTLWTISVTRAIALIIILLVGEQTHRRYDLLTALAFVAIIYIAENPYTVFSVSFQMSFLAVASIAFLHPVLRRKIPDFFSIILSVQIGMLPYTVYVFNYIPLLGLICNIPVVFAISLLVPLGLLCLCLFCIGLPFDIFREVTASLSKLVLWFNKTAAADKLFAPDMPSPPFFLLAIFYIALFFLCSEYFTVAWSRRDKMKILLPPLIACILAVSLSLGVRTAVSEADVVFVDVGQGDCLHIKDGNTDILIDGGGNINYDVGEKILKPYLLKNRVTDIDLSMATHLHTDHYLGLKQLKKCFPVKKEMVRGIAGTDISVSERCHIKILWPLKVDKDASEEDENINSMVFKVFYDDVSVLVTGDITEEGEKMLLNLYKGTDVLNCDVLKVAHHGSKYSSSENFLEAVSPKLSVISVGKNNYGHPAEETLKRLKQCGSRIYRTDKQGACGLHIEGAKMSISTMH